MTFAVIDSSIAAKALFLEEGTQKVQTLLDSINFLIEPTLFQIELEAIISKKVRRKEITIDEGLIKKAESKSFKHTLISYNEIETVAFEISTTLPVTLYDATYVATAIWANIKFYTADERLVRGLEKTKLSEYVKSIYD